MPSDFMPKDAVLNYLCSCCSKEVEEDIVVPEVCKNDHNMCKEHLSDMVIEGG